MSVQVVLIERACASGVLPEVDWLTCLDDQLDHAVTAGAVASTSDSSTTRTQQAVCGTVFVTAPPGCLPRPPCLGCAEFVRTGSVHGAAQQLSAAQARGRTRREWWRRQWMPRSRRPAGAEPNTSRRKAVQ
jgi:hypothetical protein